MASEAIQFHDKIAQGWSDRYSRGAFARRAAFISEKIFSYVDTGERWLDVGCGSGFFSRLLASRGKKVVAVDASTGMIAAAVGDTTSGTAEPVEYMVGDADNLQFRDDEFDGCICLSVLEYVDDLSACLSELARVTTRGGTIILSIPNRRSLLRRVQKLLSGTMHSTASSRWNYINMSQIDTVPNELARTLAAHGLDTIRILSFDPLIPRFMHGLLPPSLLFAIARRKEDAPRS